MTDVKPERLAVARALGADLTIDVREQDRGQAVRDLTDGYDCVADVTGLPVLATRGGEAAYGDAMLAAGVGWIGRPAGGVDTAAHERREHCPRVHLARHRLV